MHRLAGWASAAIVVCVVGTGGLLALAVRRGFVVLRRIEHLFDPSTNAKVRLISVLVVVADVCAIVFWLFAMAGRNYEKQRLQGRALMGFCSKCGYDLASTGRPVCPECGTPTTTYEHNSADS